MSPEQITEQQIGIIIVTHVGYGTALLRAAEIVVGSVQDCASIQVETSFEVEETVNRLKEAVDRLNTGKGVLVLTDMFGGTPTNLSLSLLGKRHDVEVLTGVNLPMLLRVFSNRQLPLEELTELALKAGRDGIVSACQVLRGKTDGNRTSNGLVSD